MTVLPVEARALRAGGCAVAFLLVGFTVGDHLGVPAWAVVVVVVAGLALQSRRLPWAAVPLDARSLGVDATARSFSAVGLRVGIPAFAAAIVVRLLVRAL
ncbi:MAG: hypothetical protein M3P97_09190 [Actinomycetota bacterium]|jgi:hypothetical protein|nr:hypothetical protein [Actinomycetota bacterium]